MLLADLSLFKKAPQYHAIVQLITKRLVQNPLVLNGSYNDELREVLESLGQQFGEQIPHEWDQGHIQEIIHTIIHRLKRSFLSEFVCCHS